MLWLMMMMMTLGTDQNRYYCDDAAAAAVVGVGQGLGATRRAHQGLEPEKEELALLHSPHTATAVVVVVVRAVARR